MMEDRHVLITGGAGYIGAYLTGRLLRQGYCVTVVDDLLYGGEALLAYFTDDHFHFVKADVCEGRAIRTALRKDWPTPDAIIHLAAIAGFPACQSVGRLVAWRYNVESTQQVFSQADELGIERFVYLSTYSNYGLPSGAEPVTEEAPLNPQSLYAETKVASERYLQSETAGSSCAALIFRPTTLYGMSPRPRFDLIVNQFVYEAFSKRRLMIYQRGYLRSFVHIADAVHGIILGLQSPVDIIRGQVYNLGADDGNLTKDQVVELILKRLPETNVEYKDITFGGDMRDITVSFDKATHQLGFITQFTVDDGVREVLQAIQSGVVRNPMDEHFRNVRFIVQ
jgi:nucleoside-diphosphate-sugar epimerase